MNQGMLEDQVLPYSALKTPSRAESWEIGFPTVGCSRNPVGDPSVDSLELPLAG